MAFQWAPCSLESLCLQAAVMHPKLVSLRLFKSLQKRGFKVIDCQVYNEHLGTLGAENISRKVFHKLLREALDHTTIQGSWSFMLEEQQR